MFQIEKKIKNIPNFWVKVALSFRWLTDKRLLLQLLNKHQSIEKTFAIILVLSWKYPLRGTYWF